MSYATFSISGPVTVHLNTNVRAGRNFYTVLNARELLSALGSRRSETPKQAAHGAEGSLSYYGPRFLPFEGEISAVSEAQRISMEQNLRRALALPAAGDFAGDDGNRLLSIRDEDGIVKQIYAKVQDMPEFSLLAPGRMNVSRFRFTMIADDPILYASVLTTREGIEGIVMTGFKLWEGSLSSLREGSLPTLQEVLGNQLVVTTAGTIGTPPVIIIHGPTTNPTLTNVTTRKSMTIEETVNEGERLEIDVANMTVTHIDSAGAETDVLPSLTTDSDWIYLEPGGNALAVTDESPSTLEATLSVRYRDAYV